MITYFVNYCFMIENNKLLRQRMNEKVRNGQCIKVVDNRFDLFQKYIEHICK